MRVGALAIGFKRSETSDISAASTTPVQPVEETVEPGLKDRMPRPAPRPRRLGRRALVMAATLILIAAIGLGWRYGMPRAAETRPLVAAPFQAEIRGPGILDAIRKVSVSANMQGVLHAVHVDIGDAVHAGDILAALDAHDLEAQLDSAIATHTAAQRAVELAQADRRRIAASRVNAFATLDRQQRLIGSGATTQSALDAAQMAHDQALADGAKAEAAVSQAEASEAAAAASVRASRALLDKSIIRAPMDGVIVARKLNPGDLVAPGAAILELVDPASIVLSTRFDESIISVLAPGQPARLQFGATDIAAAVRRIGREVDTETREFTVDITPSRLPTNWAMGQRGNAVLSLGVPMPKLAVPLTAITSQNGEMGVFVVEAGRARWRAIATGASSGQLVEVRDGLVAGDHLITAPKGVYPGLRITSEKRP